MDIFWFQSETGQAACQLMWQIKKINLRFGVYFLIWTSNQEDPINFIASMIYRTYNKQ